MVTVDTSVETRSRWVLHLRGHFLQFDPRPIHAYGSRVGARLLLTAVLLEVVRVAAVQWFYPRIPLWLLFPLLLGVALLSVRGIAGIGLSQIGLLPWRDWTVTEKSYTFQVLVLAMIVFPIVLGLPLANGNAQGGGMWRLWTVFVPFLCFGLYQELVYRGLVQLELVRRWGAAAGVVVANVLFTFGPLHDNYFAARPSVAWPMFAGIFVIGLFFGVVYKRSGNLWIVALMHAIGNAYVVTTVGAIR